MDRDLIERTRREVLRWRVLQTLNIGRPYALSDDVLLQAVGGPDMPLTLHDLRRELDYLSTRGLVEIEGRGLHPRWDCKLTRHGVDLAEYEIDCEPGIARPAKYW
ncbi:MAG: cytoplasmic protein [Sinobacteraceae bacterium]|nr:cytoplasmic protein [Nevskiaceae bacterium]